MDARLAELELLTRLEREGSITFKHKDFNDPEVRIAISLLAAGVVNDATAFIGDEREFSINPGSYGFGQHFRQRLEHERWEAIGRFQRKQQVEILSTHASSVRRAELHQSIQRSRLRDPMGILIDGRYAKRDLQLALYSASSESPVTVAFVDMNGLKLLNDTYGHDVGDDAVRAYFEVIADVIAEAGEAHRIGGDEVVITLPGTSLEDGAKLLRIVLRGVQGREVRVDGPNGVEHLRLTAVAGITCSKDPTASAKAVREQADKVQYRAKEFSKKDPTRFAALAIDGQEEIERVRIDTDGPAPT